MNSELIDQVGTHLGANGLPYLIPIHPNLVHLTLGLFIIGVTCDVIGVMLPLGEPILKYMSVPATRANFFDVGWYNMAASAVITCFTVAAGFYEIMLAQPSPVIESAWGIPAMDTMIWHGVGGVFLFGLIIGMTVWRGLQRYIWRKEEDRQVQYGYLLSGFVIMFIMYLHGTLGAQMAAEFGVHNTADYLLRVGENPSIVLK
ncbi:MAG: DUF2231 domain-containing protein [Scytonematopsis contorta HA4267-MV1]|jgi:uncharacterized membrane protein|nr:DUF2231 domain-containing protein [Scytonematopsis contorta HA4267-MV1]